LPTSLKNIGLDVAGTGIGGFAGVKLGAAVGTFVAPGAGTVIGGVLGGVAGAFGGRFLSNTVKTEPLNEAKASYEHALEAYKLRITAIDEKAKEKYDQVVAEETSKLRGVVDEERKRLTEFSDAQIKAQKDCYVLDDNSLASLAQNAHCAIHDQIEELNRQLKTAGFFTRFVWPLEDVFRLKTRIKRSALRQKEFERGIKHILDSASTLTQEDKTNLMFELLCAVGVDAGVVQHLVHYKEHSDDVRPAIELETASSKRNLAEERHKGLEIIAATVNKIKGWAEAEIGPVTEHFRKSQSDLLIEMRKLGIATN